MKHDYLSDNLNHEAISVLTAIEATCLGSNGSYSLWAFRDRANHTTVFHVKAVSLIVGDRWDLPGDENLFSNTTFFWDAETECLVQVASDAVPRTPLQKYSEALAAWAEPLVKEFVGRLLV